MRRRSGSTLVETAMWIPIIMLLLMGMVELARVSYTYYTLQKILYTLGRFVGTQQGLNFCDESSEQLQAAINYALRGAPGDAELILPELQADMIQIRVERRNPESDELEECECSSTGCDAAQGGLAPDYLVVSLPDGYPIRLNIPRLLTDPIPLRPVVRIPFGGT